MSKKEKFALYLTPEKKARLERRYQEDGSRSITGFIERAIDFYLDYLSANNAGLFLPTSIQSYLDGRVGPMAASRSKNGCGNPGRTMTDGKTDRQKPVHQVRRRQLSRRIHEIHRHP